MITDEWFTRLRQAVEEDGRSWGAISEAAGLSRNYLGGVLRDGKEPTIGKLLALCKALKVSPAYILCGTEATPETVEIMALVEDRPEAQAALLALLQGKAGR